MTCRTRGDAPRVEGRPAAVDRSFFARPGRLVAPDLLGLLCVRETTTGLIGGLIVEAEAYGGPDDRASHARAGPTARTAPMFGPPGHAYVYRIYGLHWCLNVVTEQDGTPGAVLIRGLMPVLGLPAMRALRDRPSELDDRLAAGPARLCQALAIDGTLDRHDLTRGEQLWIARPSELTEWSAGIAVGPRIGVAYAGSWAALPLRFGLRGHPALSRPFPGDGTG